MSIIDIKDGLLWRDGKVVTVGEADRIAQVNGFAWAELMAKEYDGKALLLGETNVVLQEVAQ